MPDPRARLILDAEDRSANAFRSFEANIKNIERQIRFVSRLVPLAFAGFSIGEFAKAASDVGEFEQRIRSLGAGSSVTRQQLVDLAQASGLSIKQVAEKYQEAIDKARESGKSQSEAGEKAINALILQGAAATETSRSTERLKNSIGLLIEHIGAAAGVTGLLDKAMDGLSSQMDRASGATVDAKLANIREEADRLQKLVAQYNFTGPEDAGWVAKLLGGPQQLATYKTRLEELRGEVVALGNAALQEIQVTARMRDQSFRLQEINLPDRKKPELNQIPDFDAAERERARVHLAEIQKERAAVVAEKLQQLNDTERFSQNETERERAAWEERIQIVNDAYQRKLIGAQQYENLMSDIMEKSSRKIRQAEQRDLIASTALQRQKIQAVQGLVSAIADALTAGGEASKKDFDQHKKIALAAAIVDTAAAVVLALRSAPPPINFITAAAVAAAGLAQVQRIRATQWEGGGSGGGVSAGGGASAGGASDVSANPAPTSGGGSSGQGLVVNVNVTGIGRIDGDAAREIGQAIADEINNNDFMIANGGSRQAAVIRTNGVEL